MNGKKENTIMTHGMIHNKIKSIKKEIKQENMKREQEELGKNLLIPILTLTLFGCWKVPASRGPRGSQSLMLESQAPVITTFTSGQNSTHLYKKRILIFFLFFL